MKTYKIIGYNNNSFEEVKNVFQHIVAQSSTEIDCLSMKFCDDSVENIASLLGNYNNGKFNMYSWKKFDKVSINDIFDISTIKAVFITSGRKEIRISYHYEFTEYQKYGLPKKYFIVSFCEYIDSEKILTPKIEIENYLMSELSKTSNSSGTIKFHFSTASGRSSMGTSYCYMYFLEKINFNDTLKILLPMLDSTNILLGSFEHYCTLNEIQHLLHKNHFIVQSYPSGIYNLSGQDKIFSYCADQGNYGLLFDIPNCTFEEGLIFLEKVMGKYKVPYFRLGMSYIPWKIKGDSAASLTQGNQVRCYINGKKVTINIGIEQYGDNDQPVRIIKKSMDRYLEKANLFLK